MAKAVKMEAKVRVNRKALGALVILGVVLWVLFASSVFAQEAGSDDTTIVAAEDTNMAALDAATTDWKQEFAADRQQIKGQKEDIKNDSQAARQEEKDLREQIRQAVQSGDNATAQSLREKLKAMHGENMQQKQQDRQALKDARQEMRGDKKEARIEALDTDQNGQVSREERQAYRRQQVDADKDNNPPGPRGGPGTNWENPPGPKGGPGSSQDIKVKDASRVNRPWEKAADANKNGQVDKTEFGQWNKQGNNPPGAKGGPGASPNRKPGGGGPGR